MGWRRFPTIVIVSMTILSHLSATSAAQEVCSSLRERLAQYQGVQGAEGYLQQNAALAEARATYERQLAIARQRDCMRLILALAPEGCREIRAQLDFAAQRVREYQRAIRSADPRAVARADILAAMTSNGCSLQPTFRTLCVRPSDGYFYPLAYEATEDDFEVHQLVCSVQCSGAILFTHRSQNETIDDAVDLSGTRYVELTNAFAFREEFDPANRCEPMPTYIDVLQQALIEGFDAETVVVAERQTSIPLPLPRPEPFEDPETLANRAGGFAPGTVDVPPFEDWTAAMISQDGYRQIGPAYYYAR